MSVKIWDSASQAYAEPQSVPKRYDTESSAYVDTTGQAYSEADAAWEEKWSPNKRLYLYNEGDECTDVTGGWYLKYHPSYQSTSYAKLTKNTDNMCFQEAYANYYASVVSKIAVDVTDYSKIFLEGSFYFGKSYNNGKSKYRIMLLDSDVINVQPYTDNVDSGHAIITDSVPEGSWESEQTVINLREVTYSRLEFDISNFIGKNYIYLIGLCGLLNLTYNKIWFE